MANLDNSWVVDIERLINAVDASSKLDPIWTNQSIYMVPALIKDLNPTAYKPQFISFGPYHYGDEKLKPMEIHKHRALIHFLKRAQKPLEGFMSALEEVADVLMDSYQSLDKRWRGARELFLKLMLFDGCFMLEVLRFREAFRSSKNDYDKNDPIFSRHGMLYIWQHIRMDMLRIENQLPLLVLKKLVAVETGRAPDDNEINQLLLDFMGLQPVPSGGGPRLHPLDLFRRSCLRPPGDRTAPDSRQAFLGTLLVRARAFLQICPRGTATQASGRPMEQNKVWPYGTTKIMQTAFSPVGAQEIGEERPMPMEALESGGDHPPTCEDHLQTGEEFYPHILLQHDSMDPKAYEDLEGIRAVPSASRLVEAGIRFRKSKTGSLHNISFEDGVLSLPAITVDDTTECLLLNLMAFEHLHVGAGNKITSYVYFMDVMVDSAKDVAVLASKGIIHNAIGTDKAVAELFNCLGKYASLDSGSGLRDVLRSVKKYCARGWNKWRAKMIHFYFKSPWANSVAAFVFLLLLTLLQTVYTVLQYHTRSS